MKAAVSVSVAAAVAVLAAGCSSAPSATPGEPAWIHQPTRTVDNGYIIYVGSAEDPGADRAQHDAEMAATEDLANECSFVPKGTRIEDRYYVKQDRGYKAYAKVALEFQDCEAAKQATDPAEIRRLANEPLTQQLAQYQQLAYAEPEEGETAATGASGESGASGAPASTVAGAPGPAPIQNTGQYFIVRQQVAYAKEVVILAPPTAYAPGTPQATQFTSTVAPQATQIQTYEKANPETRTWPHAWSGQPNHQDVPRPAGLRQSNPGGFNPNLNRRNRNAWRQQQGRNGNPPPQQHKKRRGRGRQRWGN